MTKEERKQKDKLRTKVLSELKKGKKTEAIANKLGVTVQTVAAYKAHLTMGSY